MRLITINEQLYSLLPNIFTIVKGERQLIEKICEQAKCTISNLFEYCHGKADSRNVNYTSQRFLITKKKIKNICFD